MKRIYIRTIGKFGIILLMVLFGAKAIFAQWTINEGFEGGSIPSNWTIYDENDDGEQWGTLQHNYAHSGAWFATVQCYGNDGDDWLITPRVTIQNGDVFTFFARAWYSTEDMKVRLSTTGKKKNNFNVLLESVTGLGSSYQEFTYDLSAYNGQQVYLAIQWLQDSYSLVVDDIKVGQPQASDVGVLSIESPLGFNMLGSEIVPSCTVKNFGASELSDDFPVGCNIRNAENTIVYSETLTFTSDLQPSETGQVSFSSWLAADTGAYIITMFTSLPGDGDPSNDTLVDATTIVLHYGTGGPDLMGYRWIDSDEPDGPEYNWIEISGTGTSVVTYGVNAFVGDDNFSEPIPIGFDFPFYGINRSYFHADINGAPHMVLKNPQTLDLEERKECAIFAASYSSAWKSKIFSLDVYSVKSDQVSKTANPGESLGKGAFVIRGKREYFRNVDVKLAIGYNAILKKIVCGPVKSIEKSCDTFYVIIPGDTKKSDVAKILKTKFENKEISVRLDNLIAILPSGDTNIVK